MRGLALAFACLVVGCGHSGSAPAATPSSSGSRASTPSAAASTTTVNRDQPLVVVVRADWCPTCRKIEPTVAVLQREYGGRVSFLILDVTDDAASTRSTSAAERAGVGSFFRDNNATGIVAVFTRGRAEVAKLAGEVDVERYRTPLATAMTTR